MLDSVPNYPKFRKLKMGDKSLIDRYRKDSYMSDHYFSIMYCWNKPNANTYISVLNGNLLFKNLDIEIREYVISIIGIKNLCETVKVLLTNYPSVRFLTEEQINLIKADCDLAENISILEDRNNFDYVYSTEKLTSLNGGMHKNRRWVVNTFNRNSPEVCIKTSNKLTLKQLDDIKDLFYKWESNKVILESKINYEKIAYLRYLKHRRIFNLLFVLFYIDNKLIAVGINELSNKNCSLFCFMKADTSYKHILSYCFYQNTKILHGLGVKFMNAESDLGIENLRSFKLLWRPEFLIKKFSITKQ